FYLVYPNATLPFNGAVLVFRDYAHLWSLLSFSPLIVFYSPVSYYVVPMVLLKDARVEFYQEIIGKRVLVFVLPNVDGMCAWRILKELFICRQVLYTLLVIFDKENLRTSYERNKHSFLNVILINCGANFDVIEALGPEHETIFYICDSHRPIHVNNFYNQRQVKLISIGEDTSDVPRFEEIFRQSSVSDFEVFSLVVR
ncbi:unnamed protein product, partial [Dicrocoelium dendriticum]